MSHNIAMVNGQNLMAFVGQVPWHGLGQRLPQGASIEEWSTAAGFNWSIKSAPVVYTDESGVTRNLMGQRVLYADDNGQGLSVVSDQFQVVQPREVLEFFRDYTAAGGLHLHTAGMLNERKRFWAMAKNGGDAQSTAEVVPGDQVRLNILMATAADGTMKTVVKPTAIRVVCANTLGMALKDGHRQIAVSHKSKFDPKQAQARLEQIYPAFGQFVADMRALALKRFNPEQARELLVALLAKPAKVEEVAASTDRAPVATILPAIANVDSGSPLAELLVRDATRTADQPKDPRAVAKVLELFGGSGRGANHEGVRGTGWGLLNAFTEYTDWQAGRNSNNRVDSAWFGRADDMKAEFVQLLKAA